VPTKIEKDLHSGHDTTGHEWDGVRELNTPLPKWWLYVLYATIIFAVVWCVLYPSVPYGTGYFHGLLGYSQRKTVDADVAAVAAQRAGSMEKIQTLSFADIRKDPQLLAVAETAGRITFANNCQPCHGAGGGGQPGYPALAAGDWMWGGTLEAIQQTVTHGIRSGDPDARTSQMPRFGVDGMLTVHGVAAPEHLDVTVRGDAAHRTYHAVGHIERRAFHMSVTRLDPVIADHAVQLPEFGSPPLRCTTRVCAASSRTCGPFRYLERK